MKVLCLINRYLLHPVNFISCLIFLSFSWSAELSLESVDVSNGTLDVYMSSDVEVGGFQFEINGLDITGASGGSAAENGFTISTSSSVILGFSFTGGIITPGNGAIAIVTMTNDMPGMEFTSDVCFDH